jgi:putative endonuclease
VAAPVPPPRPSRRQVLGRHGEGVVARWYEERGYSVLDRNWRVRGGELDLVVARPSMVVFCEVKARSGLGFGAPVEAVTVTKQRRIRSLAAQWLASHDHRGVVRFDVATVLWTPGTEPLIEVLEGVF